MQFKIQFEVTVSEPSYGSRCLSKRERASEQEHPRSDRSPSCSAATTSVYPPKGQAGSSSPFFFGHDPCAGTKRRRRGAKTLAARGNAPRIEFCLSATYMRSLWSWLVANLHPPQPQPLLSDPVQLHLHFPEPIRICVVCGRI